MSRVADEKNERPKRKPTSNGQAREPNLFVVYHPTSEEKDAIRAKDLDVEECLAFLEEYIALGHRLIIGQRTDNVAYYAHLREGSADYNQAVTLSCFHGSTRRCLQMLVHGLQGRYASFPNIQLNLLNTPPEW